MFCNKCGSELPEGASFCTSCGSRQNSTPDSTPAIEPQTSKEVRPPEIYSQPEMPHPAEPLAKPKKKGIFLKVIIALVLILALASGVTVLGYYTFLPAKTTLMVAQYASVLKSYDTFDKEFTQYEDKILKPHYENTIAKEGELSFSLDRSTLDLLGLDSSTLNLLEENIKNVSLKYGYALDAKNKKQTVHFGLNYLKNPALTANLFVNGTQFGFGVPELFNRTIVGDLKNLDNLTNLMPDLYQEDLDLVESVDPWISVQAYNDIKLDRKAVKNVMVDFSQTFVKSIDSSDMSIKRGKTTELFGKDVKCQEVTIKLDQKAQKALISDLLTMAKDNKDFYDLTIGNLLKFTDLLGKNPAYAELLGELDLKESMSRSNYKKTMLDLKSSLDESDFPEQIIARVYIKGLDVVKYDITIPVDDEEMLLTIEKENNGLSHKTNVTLSGDIDDEKVTMNLSAIKDYDKDSDTSDFLVEFNLDADTYDFVGNVNFTLDSKEKAQSKNKVNHDITASLSFNGDVDGYDESGKISATINGTKARNSKNLVTESSYKGNLKIDVPSELQQPIGMGFALDTETTYGQKVEIPTPDKTLDIATATQDDLDNLVNEIYEKLGAIQMLIGSMM